VGGRMNEWLIIGDLPKLEAGFTPKNLRVLMTERNLSVKALAEKLNVKEGTVSRWRNGRATMPHDSWILVLESKT
jgi:hypothetical protein